MARLAGIVVPGVPHHVTQRGNRRQFLAEALTADEAEFLRRHERTGRPRRATAFLDRIERRLHRSVRPAKPGRKPKRQEK